MPWNPVDIAKAALACLVCLIVTLGWVHLSRQTKVPRSLRNTLVIATRLLIMLCTSFLVFCAWLGVSVNFLLVLVAILLALSPLATLDNEPIFGTDVVGIAFGFAALTPVFILKQIVLGFPERDHVILSPSIQVPQPQTILQTSLVDGPLANEFAKVIATLKPMGKIEFKGGRFNAISLDGSMIDVGQIVQICGQEHGLFTVCVATVKSEVIESHEVTQRLPHSLNFNKQDRNAGEPGIDNRGQG